MERLQISIPKPCHQDWNKMTPEERGRFCSACKKTVVDFSDSTEDEIIRFIHSHREQNICGRFRNEQLNRSTRIELPVYIYQSKLSFLNSFIVALLFCFGTTLFSCSGQSDDIKGKVKIDAIEITMEGIKEKIPAVAPPTDTVYDRRIMGEVVMRGESMDSVPDTAESLPLDTVIELSPVDIIAEKELLVDFTVGALVVRTVYIDDVVVEETDSIPDKSPLAATEESSFASVYPNPSSGLFSVKFRPDAEQDVQIDFFDMNGKLIRNIIPSQLLQAETRTLEVDASDQPPGIYFLRISLGDKVKTEKIVIAK